MKNLSCGRICW